MQQAAFAKFCNSNIYFLLRDKICTFFERNPVRLGGEESIVQINESKLNFKPKYQQGGRTENEIWVFGIIDSIESPGVFCL